MATKKETEVYEMSTQPVSPGAASNSSTEQSALGTSHHELEAPLNVQQLPPVDGGWQAWMFCGASFILETLVWGFGFR